MARWDWIRRNSYKRNIIILCCSLLVGTLSGMVIARYLHDTNQKAKAHSDISRFSSLLTEKRVAKVLGAVAKLAIQPQLIKTVSGQLLPDNPAALLVLEHAKFLCDTSLIYLLNRDGDTVACTTYGGGKTLTGKNYAFRPYFIQPMRTGHNYSYPALGVTTGKRGLYFSAPVRVDGENIGVVVIKVGLNFIDEELNQFSYPCAMLTQNGIVFASNRPEWLFKTVYPLSPEDRARLMASKQFAEEPLLPLARRLYNQKGRFIFEDKTVISTIIPVDFYGFSYISLFPLQSPPLALMVKTCTAMTLGFWLSFYTLFALLDRRRLLGVLRLRENDYHSIVDNLRTIFFRVDNQDRFIRVSPAMIELYQPKNCGDKGMVGCKAESVWLEVEKWQELLSVLRDKNGKIKDFACQLVRTDGSVAHVILNASYFYAENGEVLGIEGLISDISDLLQLQQQLLLLDSAIQVASSGIVITDVEGTMIWINYAFTRMTGYGADEAIGQKTNILKSGYHEVEFYTDMWQTIISGQVWHGDLSNKRKDGSIYLEEMTITPVFGNDGEITNFIAIKTDLSDSKKHKDGTLEMEGLLTQQSTEAGIKRKQTELAASKGSFPDLSGVKILLVIDNSFEQLLVVELLQKQYGSVSSVSSEQDMLSALAEDSYSLILLDSTVAIANSGMSQFKNAIGQSAVILLTTVDVNKALSQKLGAQGTILKPFNLSQFFAEIERCLSLNMAGSGVRESFSKGGMVLNRKTALNRVLGDEKTYARLLQCFKEDFRESVKGMVTALETGKIAELKMMVHTLKGAAGGVGGDILSQNCAKLEKQMTATADKDQLLTLLESLAGHLDDLLAEIVSEREYSPLVTTNPAGNKEIAQRLFHQYGSAIAAGKLKEGQKLSRELNQYDWSHYFSVEIADLQQLLDGYTFDKAAILLRTLEQKMEER